MKIYKVSVKITGFGFRISEGAYEEMKKFEGVMYFRNTYQLDKYVEEIYDAAERFYHSYHKYGIEITNYGDYSICININRGSEEFVI